MGEKVQFKEAACSARASRRFWRNGCRPRGGAGLHGGHGLIRGVLQGRAEAHSGLRLVVLLPALGSQVQEVRLAGPCTTRSRRVQPITTNQAGASIGKVLQNFDQELCCGEHSGVCAEVGDHAEAEVLTELRQIEGRHVEELSLPVESAFQEDGVQMGIEYAMVLIAIRHIRQGRSSCR